MEATELRLDNILNRKYWNPNPKGAHYAYEACEVTQIGRDRINARIKGGMVLKFKHDELEPIPLTEEWLKRAGFEENDTIAGDFQKGVILLRKVNYGIPAFNKDLQWTAELNTNRIWEFLCKIPYVHQLQNLYYALTGEELTFSQE